MKDYVKQSVILGIGLALATLKHEVYARLIADKQQQPILSLSEITEILEKLIENEKDI